MKGKVNGFEALDALDMLRNGCSQYYPCYAQIKGSLLTFTL